MANGLRYRHPVGVDSAWEQTSLPKMAGCPGKNVLKLRIDNYSP